MKNITQKYSEAEQNSQISNLQYEKASEEAKNAATLSLELREELRQMDIKQKFNDWNYEYQRLSKSINSSRRQLEELELRKQKSEEELKKIANRPEEIAQRRGQLIETKGFAETERKYASDRLAEADQELKSIETNLRNAQNDLANVREA